MTCILCHSWNQSDPNCGHYLLNGVHMPSKYFSRDSEPLGSSRAFRYAMAENSLWIRQRTQHIENQATKALSGGWTI